jgi:CDP-glucose 4,6-dehydratase
LLNYDENFWHKKRVLITGHTGFKGSWLSLVLKGMGADIIGVSNSLVSEPSLFEILCLKNKVTDYRLDITDVEAISNVIKEEKPDIIFHLAAQALVRKSLRDPFETFRVNAMGMAAVCDAVRLLSHAVPTILITSDKVYENKEWYWGYRENDQLGGKDPYSASKACAELIAQSYLRSVFPEKSKLFAIARAGNVIGGGDWAADRLIPDCYRSWQNDGTVEIRMPDATRPWQHVLEPLSGYILLAEKLAFGSFEKFEIFNFGPDFKRSSTVGEVVSYLGKEKKTRFGSSSISEAGLLALNCDKAKFELGWFPILTQEMTLDWTRDWYDNFYSGNDVEFITRKQIEEYFQLREDKCIN